MKVLLAVFSIISLIIASYTNLFESDKTKRSLARLGLIVGIISAVFTLKDQYDSELKNDKEKQVLTEGKKRDSLNLVFKSMSDSINMYRNFYTTNQLIYQKSEEGIVATKQETEKLATPIPNQISATVEGSFIINENDKERIIENIKKIYPKNFKGDSLLQDRLELKNYNISQIDSTYLTIIKIINGTLEKFEITFVGNDTTTFYCENLNISSNRINGYGQDNSEVHIYLDKKQRKILYRFTNIKMAAIHGINSKSLLDLNNSKVSANLIFWPYFTSDKEKNRYFTRKFMPVFQISNIQLKTHNGLKLPINSMRGNSKDGFYGVLKTPWK